MNAFPLAAPTFPAPLYLCAGKQTFTTYGAASRVLERRRSRRGKKGREALRVYRCEECALYHLGRSPR